MKTAKMGLIEIDGEIQHILESLRFTHDESVNHYDADTVHVKFWDLFGDHWSLVVDNDQRYVVLREKFNHGFSDVTDCQYFNNSEELRDHTTHLLKNI